MPRLAGKDRNQVILFCLEQEIAEDSEVRLVDAFAECFALEDFKFKVKGKAKDGRPAYEVLDLLKLYLYGYLNRIRSSRQLERLCKINIEVQWLLKGLRPSHMTINSFRKENSRPLLKVFREFNRFLRGEGLFDEDTVGVDGSKFRAQNSKKNNYNEKKVKSHLKYVDKQTEAYLELLDENDSMESGDFTEENRLDLAQKLDHLTQRRKRYEALEQKIEEAQEQGITQVSTTDPDARALPKKMNIVEVSYNVVATAEAKNKLITNFEVTNQHDTYALGLAARKAKRALGKTAKDSIKVLADKGFDTGAELKTCIENNIETYVAPKRRANALKDKAFNKDQFKYDHEQDCYVCPVGEQLKSNGKLYKKNNGKLRKAYHVKHYKLPFATCNSCVHRLACAGAANLLNSKGRYIERNEYEDYIEENIERVGLNKALYRKRQEIIEHPFGTIKRQWGYDYTLLKTISKVRGEFALIFTVYNLRRAITILGVKELLERLKQLIALRNGLFRSYFKLFSSMIAKPVFLLLKIRSANKVHQMLW